MTTTTTTNRPFKEQHTFAKRKEEAERIRKKYPDRIPIIAEKHAKSDLPQIDKKKYLCPSDLTVGQFMYVIRKRLKLPAEKAMFLFVGATIPGTALLLGELSKQEKDDDGFLYITYASESTFGISRVMHPLAAQELRSSNTRDARFSH